MSSSSNNGTTRPALMLGLALAAGMTVAASAAAEPITFTSQRTVVVGDLEHGSTFGEDSPYGLPGYYSDGAGAWVGGTHSYPGYPDFTTREWASAEQKSVVDPETGLVSGTGAVSIGYSVVDADLAFARSSIDVWFDVGSARAFTLDGKLTAYMDGGLGVASVRLDGPTSFLFEQKGWGAESLAYGGTLAPGSYHLTISTLIQPECEPADCTAFSWMGGGSSFDVGFQVAAVPEPATFAMLFAGLGALTLVARRRGPTTS
jgi:hypothetical protein